VLRRVALARLGSSSAEEISELLGLELPLERSWSPVVISMENTDPLDLAEVAAPLPPVFNNFLLSFILHPSNSLNVGRKCNLPPLLGFGSSAHNGTVY